MACGNVGNITPRANVCSCNFNAEGISSNCDCAQTNEIGVTSGPVNLFVDNNTMRSMINSGILTNTTLNNNLANVG